jgi:hypothetical protein
MSVGAALRFKVLERDRFRCKYCGAQDVELHVDHIIPKALGGQDVLENLATACAPCNLGKGASMIAAVPDSFVAQAIMEGSPRRAARVMLSELRRLKRASRPQRPDNPKQPKPLAHTTLDDWVNRLYSSMGRGITLEDAVSKAVERNPLSEGPILLAGQMVLQNYERLSDTS